MLDKLESKVVDPETLGIGFQFSIGMGDQRGMGFTAGFPLTWEAPEINKLIDKIVGVAERQALKYELIKEEAKLREDYRQLNTQLDQQAKHKNGLEFEWHTRGKQGPFEMTDAQKAQYNGFESNIKMLRDAIAANESKLEAWREQCR